MQRKKAPAKAVKHAAPKRSPSVDDLLDLVAPSPAQAPASPAPQVAAISSFDTHGRPVLAFNGRRVTARSTVRVTPVDIGREALVLFENNDPSLPIITGLLEAAGAPAKLVLEAGQEMVLQVGKASINLTKDGRIVIRGADVLTRSSGSNRIKGGSVSIN